MTGLLRNISIDQFSFWAGFTAGILFLLMARQLLPSLRQSWNENKVRLREVSASGTAHLQRRYLSELFHYVQQLHLASPLFSLNEILIEPRLQEPPPLFEGQEEDRLLDVVSQTLPFTPDWPNLAAWYSARTISLAEALSVGANLALVGHPGSGKTVSLAHLASQIITRDPKVQHLSDLLPVFIHVSDLLPGEKFADSLPTLLRNAIHLYLPTLNERQVQSLVEKSIVGEKLLFLVDGLDESPPDLHQEVITLLKALREHYPSSRLVVSAAPSHLGGLFELGLIPVFMAAWGTKEIKQFIEKWEGLWSRHIVPALPDGGFEPDPLLLKSWLSDSNSCNTPLETTLKIWGGFAGDTIGDRPMDFIEGYLRRALVRLPKAREALEELALQLIAQLKIAASPRELRGWDGVAFGDDHKDKASQKSRKKRKRSLRSLPGIFPGIQEYGLLIERVGGRIAFNHPVITGYLAACALLETPVLHFLSHQPDWTGKTLTSMFLSGLSEAASEAEDYLTRPSDLLECNLLHVGRWLRISPRDGTWRTKVLRSLAKAFQSEGKPIGLRTRLLAALLEAGDAGTGMLFRGLLTSPHSDIRRLAALGLGVLRDQTAIPHLTRSLEDPDPGVAKAASLALVSIGTKTALEPLASILLHGSDVQRRFVAESLAYNQEEGLPMLKEGSEMDDLLVRRAVVFGLAQVHQPWADRILEKLAMEDKEWVVRAAATHVLELHASPNPNLPKPLPPLNEAVWLIKFASQRGIGVAPGKPAQTLLLKVLQEGEPVERLAALDYLKYSTPPEALPEVLSIHSSTNGELKQAAYETLWYYAASGREFPKHIH